MSLLSNLQQDIILHMEFFHVRHCVSTRRRRYWGKEFKLKNISLPAQQTSLSAAKLIVVHVPFLWAARHARSASSLGPPGYVWTKRLQIWRALAKLASLSNISSTIFGMMVESQVDWVHVHFSSRLMVRLLRYICKLPCLKYVITGNNCNNR